MDITDAEWEPFEMEMDDVVEATGPTSQQHTQSEPQSEPQSQGVVATAQPIRTGERIEGQFAFRSRPQQEPQKNELDPVPDLPVLPSQTQPAGNDSLPEPRAPLSGGTKKIRRPFLNKNSSGDDLILRLSNEFEPIIDKDWDTVVYIGPPSQEHRQDDQDYEYIKHYFLRPYLVNSQTLKEVGSAKFNKFLGPMSARSERKLKKLGVHLMLPPNRKPKYYIDLRPMQNEDEVLLMISELTCTPGVLSWHTSHLASGIPKTLIGGKDELNFTAKAHRKSWIGVDGPVNDSEDVNMSGIQSQAANINEIPDLEPEYSTIRHYTAIKRLLHALCGQDPKLNSAPKVWTFFSIAKFFDCAAHPRVSGWVYNWLFAGSNSNFIQANPEVAYRIAIGLKSPDILRATFAMLVGERALEQAGRSAADSVTIASGNKSRSTHGRAFSHLDDDEINRIDHAAHSLTRRMLTIFESLTTDLEIYSASRKATELLKFQWLKNEYPNKTVIAEPYDMVREYIRGEIYVALSSNVQEGELMRLYRTKGFKEFGWLKRSQIFADAYNAMPLPQRLLTQSFWAQLENYGLYQESDKVAAWSSGHSLDGLAVLAPDFGNEIACVHKADISAALQQMNETLFQDWKWMMTTQRSWARFVEDADLTDNIVPPTHPEREFINMDDDLSAREKEVVRAIHGLEMAGTSTPETVDYGSLDNRQAAHDPHGEVAQDYRQSLPPFDIHPAVLLAQISMEMRRKIMQDVLTPGYIDDEMGIESEISISQMDILLCLKEDEWKYLPLWAGGLDDGSGGVFADVDVPDMELAEGFRGGAIDLRDLPEGEGSVGGSFSMAGDSEDFDEIRTDEGVSTVGKASRIATDGTTVSGGASTVMSLDE